MVMSSHIVTELTGNYMVANKMELKQHLKQL